MIFHKAQNSWRTDLVVDELVWVLQIHVLLLHGVVCGGEGQAAEGVAACAVDLGVLQDLGLDGGSHGHARGAQADVCAAVEDTLRGTCGTRKKQNISGLQVVNSAKIKEYPPII